MKLQQLLRESMNAYRQAQAEIEAGPDREERQARSRLSKPQLVKQRAAEIDDATKELENSTDPLDRKLLLKRRQLAKLQQEVNQIEDQKKKTELAAGD